MNSYIEKWIKGIKKIYEDETKLLKILNKTEEERTYTYSYLAKKQITMIDESRPDKTKSTYEQLNEVQKEIYEYLQKVAETNEL